MVYVMMMVRFPNDDDGACNDDGDCALVMMMMYVRMVAMML